MNKPLSHDISSDAKPLGAPEWEYVNILVAGTKGNDLVAGLNKAGEKGWEAWTVLAQVPEGLVVSFKRKKSLLVSTLGG